MKVKSASFVKSSPAIRELPAGRFPEFAFIGRSNVGKSSLINMLCAIKNLAKTAARPGKTQLINHFLVNEKIYFTDLPGYGFAKAGQAQRNAFEQLISSYITSRENLRCLFMLIDIRLPFQQIDKEFMSWLGKKKVPFAIIFTKCDKLSKNELDKNFTSLRNDILKNWEEMPGFFFSSAVTKVGREELLDYIDELVNQK